ncbi:MAG: hypothetical protein IPH79_13735 [Sphingomonadales bacterium]|nr:hypothetical protein [Sphingomonadales bacterium]
MAQEILPPEPEPTPEPTTPFEIDPEDLPPALEFTPVPRKRIRADGLNPMRQRAFITYLSVNGSVEMSATAVGVSANSFYQLKKAEGAESFAAVWDIAIEMGARRVLDTLMDHAIHGTPEKLLKDGEVILERRKYNTRAMMWIVQQRFPELYGGNLNLSGRPASSLPHGIQKLKEEWRKEWEEEAAAKEAEMRALHEAEHNSAEASKARFLKKYQAKVREEYFFRAEGNAIAADFALRQLAMMEVVMDVGGICMELIQEHFHSAPHGGPWSTEVSRALEDARHSAWAQAIAEATRQRARDGGEGYGADMPGADAFGVAEPEEGQGPQAPDMIALYPRPHRPFYLNEEDMVRDEVARTRLNWLGGSYRERAAAEAEWRANRQVESEGPEGDTFLPGG